MVKGTFNRYPDPAAAKVLQEFESHAPASLVQIEKPVLEETRA
jgi:hypothetical protein